MGNVPADLAAALDRAAASPRLLVVSDVDGTLAPFVDDPSAARPEPAGLEALVALAATPDTTAALVSGRALDSLTTMSGAPAGIELVGSHGAEFAGGAAPLTDHEHALLAAVHSDLERIVAGTVGAHLELKPTARVLHVRPVEDGRARSALLEAALEGPGSREGVTVTEGKNVVELAVREAGKGGAIRTLAERSGADAVVFLGDDVTDEHGFAALGEGDVGVKVGDGPTTAEYRVADIPAAVECLRRLASARSSSLGAPDAPETQPETRPPGTGSWSPRVHSSGNDCH